MPSMANITVKNAANVDVVYVAKTASAGDKSPARWTVDAANPIAGFRPVFQVQTRDNGSNNGRVFESTLRFPVLSTVAGVDQKDATVPFEVRGTLPTNVDSAKVKDAFVQLGNLLVSALVRDVADTGYAPT